MTTILLARHGETDWNRENRFQGHADPPLNETGRAQAAELAAALANEPLAAVYSSPLRRAFETAQIVGAPHGLEPVPVDALREVDVGSWQGLTRAEIEERFPEQFARWLDYEQGWDDGESYDEMGQPRARGAPRSSRPHTRASESWPSRTEARSEPRMPLPTGSSTPRPGAAGRSSRMLSWPNSRSRTAFCGE